MPPSFEILTGLAWKATAALASAALLAVLLRRHSAAQRRLVWLLSILALLALPVLERSAPPSFTIVAPATAALGPAPPPAEATAESSISVAAVVERIWQAGVVAVCAYLLAGLLALRFRFRNRQPLDGHRDVFTSTRARLPMTWGVLRPVIMLPREARFWPAERLRVVLLHERAHARRRDFVWQFLARVACALYWYHPLVWLAAGSLRKESEQACDDAVILGGEKASAYAGHLVEVAAGGRGLSAAAVTMAGHLESRIRSLLNPSISRREPSRISRVMLVTAFTAAVCLLVAMKTGAQANAGRLTGSVLDISGAAVPKTVILIAASDPRRKEITQSGEDGRYDFPALSAGVYTLEARKPGFALLSIGDVAIKAGETRKLDLTLPMGRVQETVDVVGKATRPASEPPRTGTPQRIRVGGSVQATRLIHMPKPLYPEHLQQQGVEGTVLLEGVISVEGSLLSLRNLNTLVHPELAKAAVEAVQQWRYQPTLLNGKPVEVVTTITVNYRLAP